MLTLIIIGFTVLLSMRALRDKPTLEKLWFEPFQVQYNKEYYRFISHGFVHGSGPHLFVNMFVLWMFGTKVENQLAAVTGMPMVMFLLLYLGGIGVAALPGYLRHRNNPEYRAVGASGAVAAVLFASIVLDPLDPMYIMFVPIPIPGWLVGIGYLVYEYVQDKRSKGNIAHDAHFVGALFGVLFMAALQPGLLPAMVERIIGSWS
ncbi:MAG: rhomboid family intramembrane serine protease [Flavobacteriales bacterium]